MKIKISFLKKMIGIVNVEMAAIPVILRIEKTKK